MAIKMQRLKKSKTHTSKWRERHSQRRHVKLPTPNAQAGRAKKTATISTACQLTTCRPATESAAAAPVQHLSSSNRVMQS